MKCREHIIGTGLQCLAADDIIDDTNVDDKKDVDLGDLAESDKTVSLFEQLACLHKLRAQRLAVATPAQDLDL